MVGRDASSRFNGARSLVVALRRTYFSRMSSLSPQEPVDALVTLLQRYVRGEVPLAEMVAADETLPPGTSADFAWSLDPYDAPAA
jgi:hypothetical protein